MNRSGNMICAEMLRRLGYVKHCQVITVAGTNGKGTSCHLLADYFQRRGKKVGLFTSPHLMQFNERIVVDGVMASDAMIADAYEKIKTVQGDLDLGYFHHAFLAAILIFKAVNVDLMILEVGIGGRLDAVNSLDADYVLLTSIALDHTEILGEDREKIGFEKAGVFRKGQIAVCGDFDPPQSVLAVAQELRLNLLVAGRDFHLEDLALYPEAFIPRQNALVVWALLKQMDSQFDSAIFAQSLAQLHIPGRMQIIAEAPQILIDVAHNPHAVAYLSDYLNLHPVSGRTYAIFSALQEKDIAGMCQALLDKVDHWFLIKLSDERAAEWSALHEALPGAHYTDFQNMAALRQAILKQAGPDDRIIVFGSFMLVNLFLECHNQENQSFGSAHVSII